MTGAEFISLVCELTGTPVKEVTNEEVQLLDAVLADESRVIDRSRLNELLLLVNKDRMGRPLYDRLFGKEAVVASIRDAVRLFQVIAMLRYGNFIHAYRTLSRISDKDGFDTELGDLPIDGAIAVKYESRTPALFKVIPIAREDTPLIGYLSAATITAESVRGRLLLDTMEQEDIGSWEELEEAAKDMSTPNEFPSILALIARYRNGHQRDAPARLQDYLQVAVPQLEQRNRLLADVQANGAKNQEIYLTWDHMDVYFATSMRKAWEYTDLYDFVNEVMSSGQLQRLGIRHFDPTQSYAAKRIDKGLVESLMLKRAKCTVYSVQDTDTLGKDSELAATLAQGKPVIAYVPSIEVPKRTEELSNEDPLTILDRLRFVIYADDAIGALDPQELGFLDRLTWLTEFERQRVFRSLPDPVQNQEFRDRHSEDIRRLARIIAGSEQRVYDSRYRTLREKHPLGIQVNLDTGVANGVLVVRNAETCSDLLSRILSQTMEFIVDQDEAAWYLRERISECVYRVVTKNLKVSNCFWNFYLRS